MRETREYLKCISTPLADAAGSFVNADIRSFACVVGVGATLSAFDRYLEAAKQVALYIEETPYNIYAGYDDLVACEYSFYMNRTDAARNHAHSAIVKARGNKQYSIAMTAEKYLLDIAMYEGNAALAKEALKQMHSFLDNSDFWNRQLYYDLYTGVFYAQLGLLEMVPQWFFFDERELGSAFRLPIRELIINVIVLIVSKKYEQALMVLCNSYPREPYEQFLFGELCLSLLSAVVRMHVGDTSGAMTDFDKAYELSYCGVFETFFIRLGKELNPLVVEALKKPDCRIPKEWLNTINRKASIYAKKVTVVASAFRREMKIKEPIILTEREREVLTDLYHGLTREEIADNLHISINTVKTILQSIYTKLDANNNVIAVRVALEQNLI